MSALSQREGLGAGADVRDVLQRAHRWGLIVGIVALAISAVGALLDPGQFFQSYLVAYLFWGGIALGCLAMGLISTLTGGNWGAAIRDIVAAAAQTLPLMAVLFLPIAIGIPSLYLWARPNAASIDPVYSHQAIYLNVPFFLVRAVIFLASWVIVGQLFSRWSAPVEQTNNGRPNYRLRRLGAGGLILISLTGSFAIIDWVMSLETPWASTIFPAMVGIGDLLAGLAFAILVVSRLGDQLTSRITPLPRILNDLGGLLLALVMTWAYLSFSQFLLIWSGNLNAEIPWYLHRLSNGWQWIAGVAVATQFVVPFIALLSREVKRSARALGIVAAIVFVGRLVEVVWLVEPSFPPVALLAHWLDLTMAVGLGGIWLFSFASQLRQRLAGGARE